MPVYHVTSAHQACAMGITYFGYTMLIMDFLLQFVRLHCILQSIAVLLPEPGPY